MQLGKAFSGTTGRFHWLLSTGGETEADAREEKAAAWRRRGGGVEAAWRPCGGRVEAVEVGEEGAVASGDASGRFQHQTKTPSTRYLQNPPRWFLIDSKWRV